jgi:RNA polymerase sigma-70 factor (ECF subfamily)
MKAHDETVRAYESSREDVYHYLLTLGLDAGQAQETTQEVFLRLFQAMRGGEVIRDSRAWVFRVAHNLGINVMMKRKPAHSLDAGLEAVLPDRRPSPESRVLKLERAAKLRAAVATLSPQQRQCLHLRAEGLRYQEIADTVGIGVSTVGEFLSRAIHRIRKAVHE